MKPKQTEMKLGVKFVPPKLIEVVDYGYLSGLPVHECEKFHAYYSANGWKVGRNHMKSWRAAVDHWKLVWKGANHKPRTVYELTKIIEANEKIADQLKRSFSNETSTGRKWDSEDARKKFKELRAKIKELNEELAKL